MQSIPFVQFDLRRCALIKNVESRKAAGANDEPVVRIAKVELLESVVAWLSDEGKSAGVTRLDGLLKLFAQHEADCIITQAILHEITFKK